MGATCRTCARTDRRPRLWPTSAPEIGRRENGLAEVGVLLAGPPLEHRDLLPGPRVADREGGLRGEGLQEQVVIARVGATFEDQRAVELRPLGEGYDHRLRR